MLSPDKPQNSKSSPVTGQPDSENDSKFFSRKEGLFQKVNHAQFVELLYTAGFSKEEILDIELAYNFAKFGHYGQYRYGGERYFEHPKQVALALIKTRIELSEMGFENEAKEAVTRDEIIKALNHDIVEDTPFFAGRQISKEEARETIEWRLVHTYGPDVKDGILVLTKVEAGEDGLTKAEAKLASIEKIANAPVSDQLVKLADRLHNISTLKHTPEEQQLRVLDATVSDYLPIFMTLADAATVDELLKIQRGVPAHALAARLLTTRLVNELNWLKSEERCKKTETPLPPRHKVAEESESLTARSEFRKVIEQSGLSIIDKQLIYYAYDLAEHGYAYEENPQGEKPSFVPISLGTLRLIERLKPLDPERRDVQLIIGALLSGTLESSWIFGSNAVPQLNYREISERNIEKLFGREVCRLVISQTRDEAVRAGREGSVRNYAKSLREFGPRATVLAMNRTLSELLKAVNLPDDKKQQLIDYTEKYFLPVYRRFADATISYKEVAHGYLSDINNTLKILKAN
ncbi:MAG: HD domain-containing protein [Candidatus Dadabacteria bacterium]|nr:MAG: HD domain-containing protein [Candidatus Dadabacteria bacterium]